MEFGLETSVITDINNVFAKYPEIEKVVIYGSRAKGNYSNGSDIDLTFLGNSLDLSLLNKVENDLDELFLPYTFDISVFRYITNEDLIGHINRVGVVFYDRNKKM